MEDVHLNQQNDMEDDGVMEGNEEEPLLPHQQPTYLNFRLGRQEENIDKCTGFVLAVFKFCFCSLGLWGHQAWSYIPRVLVSAICIFQAVYGFHGVFGARMHMPELPLSTSLSPVISYLLFIGCLIIAKWKKSAIVDPSESMMNGLKRKNVWLLCFAFFLITVFLLCDAVLSYVMMLDETFGNQLKGANIHVIGQGAFYLAQWAAYSTCFVFAISSFALGTFAEDAFRLIRDIQNGTLDDIIRIHEDLCTVVFSTVSAYSVWFMLHWFNYAANVLFLVIFISKESASIFSKEILAFKMCLCLLFHLCSFFLPCIFAARITSSCSGVYEKINCTTSAVWNEGHPFKDRRNLTMFVSYAKKRRCGFKIGRITFSSASSWVSIFLGLLGLLFSFYSFTEHSFDYRYNVGT